MDSDTGWSPLQQQTRAVHVQHQRGRLVCRANQNEEQFGCREGGRRDVLFLAPVNALVKIVVLLGSMRLPCRLEWADLS